MPRRRAVLGAAGAAALGGLAGCTQALREAVDRDDRPYARWLHAPGAVVPAERHAFATVDLSAVRTHDENLPQPVGDVLERLDRQAGAVDLASVDRLTALGYGSLPRVGVTAVATGSFDPGAIHRSLSPATGGVVDRGDHRDHRLYAYAPRFLSDLDRFATGGVRPDVSFALGASASSLVGGVLLSPDVRAERAVRASLDARAGDAARYRDAGVAVYDLLATVGDRPVAVGCSAAAVAAVRERLPADRDTLRSVLADCRGFGVGVSLPETVLTMALSYRPADVASLDRVRALLEEATDDEKAPAIRGVSLVQRGRVIRADLEVDLERALDASFLARIDPETLFGVGESALGG